MKKILLSLGLLVAISSTANAQDARFGIKGGASYSTITGDGTKDLKNLLGLNAGLMADFSLSDLISLHPELLYSQKGFKIDFSGFTGQGRSTYIDLPILLRVKADGLFFEAGPQVGYLIGVKSESSFGGTTISSTSTEGARKVDIGYVAGVGYQLEQGLEIGVRYNGGISDLSDKNVSGAPTNRNSAFQLQVGYLFGGK